MSRNLEDTWYCGHLLQNAAAMHFVHLKMMHLVDSTGIQCAGEDYSCFFLVPQMSLVQRLAAVMDTGFGEISQGKISAVSECLKLSTKLSVTSERGCAPQSNAIQTDKNYIPYQSMAISGT